MQRHGAAARAIMNGPIRFVFDDETLSVGGRFPETGGFGHEALTYFIPRPALLTYVCRAGRSDRAHSQQPAGNHPRG
jgi:hypothetical protein